MPRISDTLAHHHQDAALNFADQIQCLQGERFHNAEMIAVAVIEGIASAKENRDVKTNGDWHDSMCPLAQMVRMTILSS